mmetsp:Transcript_23727/g.66201  ORF Transcript_23727/g.66201 Transcript_23727/m.66201 type:complete len:279 (+) Transcript_23727:2-838(+)
MRLHSGVASKLSMSSWKSIANHNQVEAHQRDWNPDGIKLFNRCLWPRARLSSFTERVQKRCNCRTQSLIFICPIDSGFPMSCVAGGPYATLHLRQQSHAELMTGLQSSVPRRFSGIPSEWKFSPSKLMRELGPSFLEGRRCQSRNLVTISQRMDPQSGGRGTSRRLPHELQGAVRVPGRALPLHKKACELRRGRAHRRRQLQVGIWRCRRARHRPGASHEIRTHQNLLRHGLAGEDLCTLALRRRGARHSEAALHDRLKDLHHLVRAVHQDDVPGHNL